MTQAATVIPFDRSQQNDLPDPRGESSPSPAPAKQNMREALESVFHKLGGVDGMVSWVQDSTANRRIFYRDIMTKLIPKEINAEITGANKGPVKLVVEWENDPIPVNQAPAARLPMEAITDAVFSEALED